MKKMIIRRIFRGLLTIVIATVLVFFVMRVLVPGDPAELLADPEATEEQIQQLRELWGLDLPLGEQFKIYVINLMKGDAGKSYQYKVAGVPVINVTDLIWSRLPNTILLAATALCIAVVVAIPSGTYMALNPGGWFEKIITNLNFTISSFPNFYLGLLLVLVFAINLGWLPTGGNAAPTDVILPATTLSLHYIVTFTRLTQTEVVRILNSDYIRTARAKGLPMSKVVVRHGMRNAAIPLITTIGLRFGSMLSGSVVTETLFRWPGIGNLMINALNVRDYPTIQVLIPYTALVFVVINLVVDITYYFLDPRLRK
jgi:peptide/nickel transport system permease protein